MSNWWDYMPDDKPIRAGIDVYTPKSDEPSVEDTVAMRQFCFEDLPIVVLTTSNGRYITSTGSLRAHKVDAIMVADVYVEDGEAWIDASDFADDKGDTFDGYDEDDRWEQALDFFEAQSVRAIVVKVREWEEL